VNESVAHVFDELDASPEGLDEEEASRRLARYGPNTIEEEARHPLLDFLRYFWGPVPWMIEIAAVLSAVLRHWVDFGIILTLLVFNALVGFWQRKKASDAIDVLRKRLALTSRVRRDGRFREIEARDLVPGDVVRVRLGDIVPADLRLFGEGYLSVDQSALTGESLPVSRKEGEEAFSGSIIRQGEMLGVVAATGSSTYFGKTARLVSEAGAASHFQKAVVRIGDYLIYLSLGLVTVLVVVQLFRGTHVLEIVQFALILVVASIPVAMPAVLSVTMAVGSIVLSKLGAIVSRLESIEEMAGMDVLCCDKTGTLTQNKLTLGEPAIFEAKGRDEALVAAALASREEDRDPIDLAVLAGIGDASRLSGYEVLSFSPFDPVHKRTEARVRDVEGEVHTVTKGAPQVILALARPDEALAARVDEAALAFAEKGYRALGVARRDREDEPFHFLALLPLLDPPREDSAAMLREAKAHGVVIEMITGDHAAIAKEIATRLGLSTEIASAEELRASHERAREELVEHAAGFSEVFPEDKLSVVKALQARGHIVGMTGDGVNDAPALKQADMGIAVSGATDAARAAADVVLTAPGLSAIVNAMEEARRIFERMQSYAVYRIAETIRIMVFVVLAMLVFGFYPITAIMIILLAFLNDVPIMAIAYDKTRLDPSPVRWDMRRVVIVATAIGLTGVVGSALMLYVGLRVLHMDIAQIQTYIFLKMSVSGHLTLFVARARGSMFARPFPSWLLIGSALSTKLLATLLAAYGFALITPISWLAIAVVWGYAIVWAIVTDAIKVRVYRHLDYVAPHHQRFMDALHRPLTEHAMTRPRVGKPVHP